MSVAIIGVVGTVASAGAAAYGAYSQNKASKKAASASGAGAASGIPFGEKPKAALYRPVDFGDEQWNTIDDNYKNLFHNSELMNWTNKIIDRDALNRANKFIPNYSQNMRLQGEASNALLSGQLPYDDVLGIVANRGELTNALGVPGSGGNATLRDLGLSRLDAIKSGSGLMQSMVNMAETVNPVSRRSRPQDMFLNPADRIRMAMSQNETIQQSEQNANNIEAGLSPSQSAASQLELAQRMGATGGGGGGGGQDYSGYAQAIQQLLAGLGGALKGSGGTAAYGNPSGSVPNFSSWQRGPQPGTYYTPTSIAA